jgi:hypothetical protein
VKFSKKGAEIKLEVPRALEALRDPAVTGGVFFWARK